MNKVIFIGELALNVSLSTDGTATTRVGDRTVGAAMLDGSMGIDTLFVGEAGADAIGDHIVTKLETSKVDTKCIDRYTEGKSPVRITSDNRPEASVMHTDYPGEPVNPVWPRINEGDVVVFGSYMAIEERNHQRVMELASHARARKAKVVYLPYFEPSQVARITRVMPEIFDNLEAADLVVATTSDLAALFPTQSIEKAFNDHIKFHCQRCLVLDKANLKMHFFDDNESWTLDCHPTDASDFDWTVGAIAGVTRALVEGMKDPDDIMAKANETAHSQLASSLK
ncbi:MAG: PfkB family carbohydrate kinase [Muribaculaceae bacterium]|nr:PfkB family carbohydrate kinase [Muribaculaceae bacterium]